MNSTANKQYAPFAAVSAARPNPWPLSGGFSPADTALLIIDMQYDFLSEDGYFATLGQNVTHLQRAITPTQRLLAKARQLGFLCLFTRESHRPQLVDVASNKSVRAHRSGAAIGSAGPLGRLLIRGERGCDIISELQPTAQECVIDKPGNGAFYATDLEHILRSNGIRHLLMCGITTDVCVSSTLREANDRGFDCLVLEDACGAASAEVHEGVFASMLNEGGIFGAFAQTHQLLAHMDGLEQLASV